MEPWRRRRYSVLLLCQCRPDVHVELGGRWMVVLSAVVGEAVVGMWYVTEEGPGRVMAAVFGGAYGGGGDGGGWVSGDMGWLMEGGMVDGLFDGMRTPIV